MQQKHLILILSVLLIISSCKTPSTPIDQIQVTYEAIPVVREASAIQKKYGKILDRNPLELENETLYTLIDEWIKTPYLLGGDTKEGIDCSSFTQLVYTKVYSAYIERTAETQFESEQTDKFRGQQYLQEGDLVFFTSPSSRNQKIEHVGVYLDNNRFVHATNRKGISGYRGVKISNLKDKYWQTRFLAGGRKLDGTESKLSSN